MKKNKETQQKNYLERKPLRKKNLHWEKAEDGSVTLHKKNEGFFNKLAQKFFKKPPVSYIHLDEHGSFIWQLLDGNATVEEIGVPIKDKFGDAAEPLYPRLVKFLSILESYSFIEWVE